MLAQAPRPPAANTGAAPPDRRAQNVSGRPVSRPPTSRPSNLRPPDSRAPSSRTPSSRAQDSRAQDSRPPSSNGRGKPAAPRKDAEHEILFQKYFKSVNPQRTYAAQVKKAGNGNHYVVFTEGRRDDATGEVRKTRLFVYSEDFIEFFRMLQETSYFIRDNPVPEEVRQKRQRFWKRKDEPPKASRQPVKAAPPVRPAPGAAARNGNSAEPQPRRAATPAVAPAR